MPADINIWILAGTGFAAGLLGAMLGVGGGFMIVPVSDRAGVTHPIRHRQQPHIDCDNAATSTSVHIRNHMTNLKLGLLLSTRSYPGRLSALYLHPNCQRPFSQYSSACSCFSSPIYMLPKKQRRLTGEELEAQQRVHEKSHASHAWLDGSYYDPAVNEEISYQVHRPTVGLVTGFFGGVISSMFGIGGGIINVPVMNRLMKIPVKATVATSGFLLLTTTMTGSLIYIYNGFLIPYVTGPLCLSVFVGARLGAMVAHRVHTRILVIIFSCFMVLMAIMMVLKGLHIFGG